MLTRKTVWTLFLTSSLLVMPGCGSSSNTDAANASQTAARAEARESPTTVEDEPKSIGEETPGALKSAEIETPAKAAVKSNDADPTMAAMAAAVETKENRDFPKSFKIPKRDDAAAGDAASRPGNKKFDDRLENVSRRVGEIVNTHKDALKKEQKRLREGLDKIINEAAINHKLP